MFGKKKKQPKIEKVFEGSSTEEQASAVTEENQNPDDATQKSNIDDFLVADENAEGESDNLSEEQRAKIDQLKNVKSKISQILRSSNIEIVDENFGDEYESGSSSDSGERSQQEYDSLKSLFGDRDKGKKQELTLTIDDFDYTYVGQYLDEYDLMHMKNIKRVRLQRKYPKHLKKFLIAAAVVAVVGLGAFLGYYLTREEPVYLKNVTLTQTEHDYFVNEIFDYTGLYLIAEYSDGYKERIKLTESHLTDITGKVEKVGENKNEIQFVTGPNAVLTFNYNGFSTSYTVNVLKKDESGLQAIYTDAIFDKKKDEFINSSILNLAVEYGAFGKEEIKFSNAKLSFYVDDIRCTVDASKGVRAVKDITHSSVIKIVYEVSRNNKIELILSYADGVHIKSAYLQ